MYRRHLAFEAGDTRLVPRDQRFLERDARLDQPDTPGVRMYPSHRIRAPLPDDFDERLHQPWQIVGCRAGRQQAIALLERQLDDRPVELRLGLA
jgi:hypothetical protein